MAEKVMIKPSRAAAMLDMAVTTVYQAINRDQIRAVRIGSAWRIPVAEIERIAHGGTTIATDAVGDLASPR